MKLSKLVGERTKTTPSDATMKNHILLLRAGYMKQVAGGIYSLTTLGERACLNIENIIREEMDALDGQEVKFPVVMPKELWDMSGRYSSIGSEMARFIDRTNRQMLLGMTHEEAAVHLVKNWVNTYTQLPCMIYQIQTKFRDEPRSRGGLIRVREFTMKDAYSFHMTEDDLDDYYYKMHKAYERIYDRAGIGKHVISVKSDNGMFGGKISHEFMYLYGYGEDQLVLCDKCGYSANQEVAECVYDNLSQEEMKPLEKVFTGEAKTIDEVSNLLKVSPQKCMKAVVYGVKGESGYVVCFVRGDREVNETKLRHVCQKEIVPYDATDDKNFCAGNIGALNLKVPNARIFYDKSLEGITNLVAGANEKEYHYINLNLSRDMKDIQFCDISKVNAGDTCVSCGGKLAISNGVEVGNIFQLGTKYTKSMDMRVRTRDGGEINPIMGCYGIGVGRLLACIIEENSDDNGICLPMNIAPFKVHIVPLGKGDEMVTTKTLKLYDMLQDSKIPTLLDDRECSNGIKFADADLIGMPIRVVVSPRSLAENQVEIKLRKTGETIMADYDKAFDTIVDLIKTRK